MTALFLKAPVGLMFLLLLAQVRISVHTGTLAVACGPMKSCKLAIQMVTLLQRGTYWSCATETAALPEAYCFPPSPFPSMSGQAAI